jgi:predicted permease
MFPWIRALAFRTRAWLSPHHADQDFENELEIHLEMLTDENVRRGMAPEEAKRAARMRLGGLTQLKETNRELHGLPIIETFLQDTRYAFRMLRKSPGFTAVAILTLALGIGANTAMFTLLHASLWRPLPVKDPQQIFHLMRASFSGDFAGEFSCSYPLFQHFSKIARPLGEIFAKSSFGSRKFDMDGASNERIAGEEVSANFFSILHVNPVLGRVFEPQDDNMLGGNHVAVLSHDFWMRRFQSDRSILGKTILYDETPYTVIGVAQPGFTGIEAEVSIAVWVPLTTSVDKTWLTDSNVNWLKLLVRLHPSVVPANAQAMFEAAFRAYVANTFLPGASPRWKLMLEAQHVTLRHAASGLATTGHKYEKPLLILLGVVALVLLISCANLANLLLARNAARQQEIMVRLALGASRARIAGQLFTEILLLSVLGAACGIVVASWGTRLLISLLPQSPLPLAFDLRPDLAVLGFTTATAVGTAVLCGLAPALRACRARTELGLGSGQRIATTSFSGRFLVAGQLGLSLPLLIGAGLFLGTLHNLKTSDLGLRPENVVTFDLSFPKATSKDLVRQTYAQIKERVEAHPGVMVASYAWPGVYGHGGWSNGIEVEGRPTEPGEDNEAGLISAGPGFFESIGLGLLQGRYLDSRDLADSPPVAVVNESFARHYFAARSPIGRRIKLGGEPKVMREIVGVVHDAKHYGVRERTWRMVYVPWYLHASEGGGFYVRSGLNPRLLSDIIRNEVSATDNIAQVEQIRPLETAIDDMISQERLLATLSSVFAALAAALTAIGLYGVMAYSVSRRTNEFGIRMALGAQRKDVQALVLRQTAPLVLSGAVIGVAAAVGLARALSAVITGMLYGIKATDIAVFAGATLSLVVIALLAAFLPARRASRIDPMVALRYE